MLLLAALAAGNVERWGRQEISLTGPSTGNPFMDVDVSATFTLA
jgi:hypothetical protein